MQGTDDPVYGNQIQAEQIKLFTSSKDATLTMLEGGNHYLSATNPTEVAAALLELVIKYR